VHGLGAPVRHVQRRGQRRVLLHVAVRTWVGAHRFRPLGFQRCARGSLRASMLHVARMAGDPFTGLTRLARADERWLHVWIGLASSLHVAVIFSVPRVEKPRAATPSIVSRRVRDRSSHLDAKAATSNPRAARGEKTPARPVAVSGRKAVAERTPRERSPDEARRRSDADRFPARTRDRPGNDPCRRKDE
jgi:hypothetical protein